MKKFKTLTKTSPPKGSTAHHGQPKPRLRARHLSTIGKSAFGAIPPDAGAPAFPSGGPGGPAFPPAPDAGGAPLAAPMDAGAGALMGGGGGPPGM